MFFLDSDKWVKYDQNTKNTYTIPFSKICLHLISLETCENIANPNYLRAIPWVIGSLFFALLVIMWPNLQYCNIYRVPCKIKLCSNMKLLGVYLVSIQ